MAYVAIAIAVIALAAAIMLQPPEPEPPPPALSDLSVPTNQEGRAIPVITGHVRIESPMVVWTGDADYSPVKTSGGK